MPEVPAFLGALERKPDSRDFPLGATSIPTPRPSTLGVDLRWLARNYQAQLPVCGPHAGSHNKAIQDHAAGYAILPRYTPRYTSIKMKDPASPVYDGYAPDAGTDMRSLLAAFKTVGANSFGPLENDTTLSLTDYLSPTAVTPAMDSDAGSRLISAYAFGNADYDSIANAVFQWKSAILLIKCDNGFWGTATPTFTSPTYGHFVTAYDYDDMKGGIWVVDSADPNDPLALKWIAKQFITPTFFFELGTTVDIPASLQQVLAHPTLAPEQKITIAQQILNDIASALTLIQKEI